MSLNAAKDPRVSVIVITWRRPGFVDACLTHLVTQSPRASEIIVVDASPDDATASVVETFPDVRYVSFPRGAGHMTAARNHGLRHVTGDVVAFVDDDAVPRPGWLRAIVEAFADPSVGAVSGRTCNGHPGEATEGASEIGRVLADGRLTANFAANPDEIVEIEHGIGANMAFRIDILEELRGFREDFRGAAVREDTDMFLRVRAAGYSAIFNPRATVDHHGAPHVRGRRFGLRYQFWARHNHALLLSRNYGIGSNRFRRWVAHELRSAFEGDRSGMSRIVHGVVRLGGVGAGLCASFQKASWRSTHPRRELRSRSQLPPGG